MTGLNNTFQIHKGLFKTQQDWYLDQDGNQVYDSPNETGALLDYKQGKVKGFTGTCGLVACVNVLRLAGIIISEADLVTFASSTRSNKSGNYLCSKGSSFAKANGATGSEERNEILKHYGIEAVSLPCDVDSIAKYVEEGRGVIISVHCNQLYYGYSDGGDLHAVCVTSVKKDMTGRIIGFYVCDSNGDPAQFYYTVEIERALSGRKMNVTTTILR